MLNEDKVLMLIPLKLPKPLIKTLLKNIFDDFISCKYNIKNHKVDVQNNKHTEYNEFTDKQLGNIDKVWECMTLKTFEEWEHQEWQKKHMSGNFEEDWSY